MKNKIESKLGYIIAGSVLLGSLLVAGTAFAADTGAPGNMGARVPGVFGTVSAINGDTITITSKGFGQNQSATPTTYTVDATNATVTKNDAASSLSNIAVGDTIMAQGTVSGTSVTATTIRDGIMGRGAGQRSPDVSGTVTSVSGNIITVTSKKGPDGSTTGTTYTVDATNATITKNGAASSLANIAVGDTIMAQGALTGTNVVATTIRDGVAQKGTAAGSQTPAIQGNGQPVVGGSVTAVNGSTITITNASNVTYTVDATNAKIVKGNATSTISSVATGDKVVVQGAVNGSSITASSVIDQGNATATANNGMGGGFMGSIKGFFHKLFGFF